MTLSYGNLLSSNELNVIVITYRINASEKIHVI
jgi:hypothetical protein